MKSFQWRDSISRKGIAKYAFSTHEEPKEPLLNKDKENKSLHQSRSTSIIMLSDTGSQDVMSTPTTN